MARVLLSGCVLLFIALCVSAEPLRFDGFELWAVTVRHKDDVTFLDKLRDDFPDVDFWTEPVPRSNVTVLVPPGLLEEVTARLTGEGMVHYILSQDVQGMVERGSAKDTSGIHKRATSTAIIDHYNYHMYDRIVQYMEALEREYPNNVQVSNLNHATHNGKMVKLAKLSGSSGSKQSIIVEAGIHAREWISPASNLWAMENMLQGYRNGDSDARMMLDKYDWYFVPVTNPDGYDYSHTSNRMWRKNRRYSSSRCQGVDLNRNFDAYFGTTGVSSRCDSDIYPGTRAFSEPETLNMKDLFDSLSSSVISYMSVHAYSQYLLVPWGYTNYVSRPENAQELDRVANLMNDALSKRHGKNYRFGTAYQLLNYAASGAAEDWALTAKKGIYAMCYELRPSANDYRGFILPANEIVPTGEEYYDSLVVLAREMK